MKVSKPKEKQVERMIQFMVAHFGDIFSDWNTKKANQFFALMVRQFGRIGMVCLDQAVALRYWLLALAGHL